MGAAAPVLVTGIGVVAPTGIGVEKHWAALLEGRLCVSAVGAPGAAPVAVPLAGQVPDFDPAEFVADQLRVQTDRWTWMSLAATTLALRDADYDTTERDPYDTSVFLAAGSGGNEFGQREIQALWSRGPKAVGAYQSIAWFYAASTGQVSIRDQLKGPCGVVVSEAAGGLDSVGWGRRRVRRGTPAVLVGGTEAALSPYALLCQATSERLSFHADPHQAYKPFDVGANGAVVAEGGAVLLLEDATSAVERGARRVWAEVAGYAATHDASSIASPPPDATQYARAMRTALADAGVTPQDVGLVIADGAGVPEWDALEANALQAVFGGRSDPVPVTAPSGWSGRMMAGGSALNVATAALVLRDQIAPAVGNLDEPMPGYGLDLLRQPRRIETDVVLVVARGYGGFNSALVLRRHGDTV